MKLATIIDSVKLIKAKRHGVPLRIITNGLIAPGIDKYGYETTPGLDTPSAVAKELKACRIKAITVFLPTASSPDDYYNEMFGSHTTTSSQLKQELKDKFHLGAVCDFISNCAEQGLTVTTTVVARPGIDVKAVQDLSLALGCVGTTIKPFFP